MFPSSSPPPLSLLWSNAANQELIVQFELDHPSSPDELDQLRHLVSLFVDVGKHGGFARETVSPANSKLSLGKLDMSNPMTPVFSLTAEQVDVRAFQLLRNGAWRWSSKAQPLRSIAVVDRTVGQPLQKVSLPDTTWTTEEKAYPPRSRLSKLQIVREDPADYQKQRRCVVECGRIIPNAVFASIAVPITAWVALAAEGVYGPPVRPSFEAEVWPENVGPYDEYSFELALSLFESSETAWNTLLNCLERFSIAVERIAQVTIE